MAVDKQKTWRCTCDFPCVTFSLAVVRLGFLPDESLMIHFESLLHFKTHTPSESSIELIIRSWLVVWNIFYFSIFPYIGNSNPVWRTHIFQRGRSTTNQINIDEMTLCWWLLSINGFLMIVVINQHLHHLNSLNVSFQQFSRHFFHWPRLRR